MYWSPIMHMYEDSGQEYWYYNSALTLFRILLLIKMYLVCLVSISCASHTEEL